jgi:hypothetical protein
MTVHSALQDAPTLLLVSILLAMMLTATEIGFRLGLKYHRKETDLSRTVSNAFKASIFGLVALLLGFSFSATTSRYDLRQRIVLDQANAIGTCYLRAGLLDESSRTKIQDILRRYVDVRLEQSRLKSADADHAQLQAQIDRLLADLWVAVEEANQRDPTKVRNVLIIPAAKEVIDLSSTRSWANRNHLPLPVLLVLVVGVIVACLLLGHSSGQTQRRHLSLWITSTVIFSLVLYVILDFDRPRRGLIRVDLTPLVELNSTFGDKPSS